MNTLEIIKLIADMGAAGLLVVSLFVFRSILKQVQQPIAAHQQATDTTTLRLVDLLSATVAQVEASTKTLQHLHEVDKETQTVVKTTYGTLQEHHVASQSGFAEVRALVEAVPDRVDRRLEPRLNQLREQLTKISMDAASAVIKLDMMVAMQTAASARPAPGELQDPCAEPGEHITPRPESADAAGERGACE